MRNISAYLLNLYTTAFYDIISERAFDVFWKASEWFMMIDTKAHILIKEALDTNLLLMTERGRRLNLASRPVFHGIYSSKKRNSILRIIINSTQNRKNTTSCYYIPVLDKLRLRRTIFQVCGTVTWKSINMILWLASMWNLWNRRIFPTIEKDVIR